MFLIILNNVNEIYSTNFIIKNTTKIIYTMSKVDFLRFILN